MTDHDDLRALATAATPGPWANRGCATPKHRCVALSRRRDEQDPPPAVTTVAGMPWPARCVRCGLVTEDPDAHAITDADEDGEYAPPHACPAASWEHEWATVATPGSLAAMGGVEDDPWEEHESEHARGQCACPCLAAVTDTDAVAAAISADPGIVGRARVQPAEARRMAERLCDALGRHLS